MVLDSDKMNPFVRPDERSKTAIFYSVTLDMLLDFLGLVFTSESGQSQYQGHKAIVNLVINTKHPSQHLPHTKYSVRDNDSDHDET